MKTILSSKAPFALVVLATALGAAWMVAGWWYPLPDPLTSTVPTLRLYAGDSEIAVLQGTSRRAQVWVPLDYIPRPVVDAVLVAEDRRFFQHHGIDLLAVFRAATTNLRHGQVRQGGSTITQQLARTLFFSTERTWGRKLRESAAALALEFRYPKERILEAYLNTVYFGHSGDIAVHGVGAAARQFLGKDIAAIRLDEAALLAAAIPAPNRILGGDPARARTARNTVLQAMLAAGMASEGGVHQGMLHPIQRSATRAVSRAPNFVDLAREEIARRVTLPPSGELRIATSLDPNLQRAAEAAIWSNIARIEERQPGLRGGKLQAALVAIEPGTGRIRAIVGGRQYPGSMFNRATRALRQPGSLFKPIVYLAAFEAERTGELPGLTPASLVPDEPTAIQSEGRTWSPNNLDRRFHGPVTVRRAIEESLNVPAVRVAQEVGLDRVARTGRALGIASPLSVVPSLALGTSEVTLLEITSAFATLANKGVRVSPTTLAEDSNPNRLRRLTPLAPPTQAVSAESAFLITHVLRGVMRRGTGRASARWGLSDLAAGKTGSSEGLRDAWFVGYTPDLAVGVWVGMDDGTPLGLTGAQAALPIWGTAMQAAVREATPRSFDPPEGVVFASVERETGRPTSVWCGGGPSVEEAFRAGTEPQTDCDESKAAATAAGVFLFGWFLNLVH